MTQRCNQGKRPLKETQWGGSHTPSFIKKITFLTSSNWLKAEDYCLVSACVQQAVIRALYKQAETGCTIWMSGRTQLDTQIITETGKNTQRALISPHSLWNDAQNSSNSSPRCFGYPCTASLKILQSLPFKRQERLFQAQLFYWKHHRV